MRFDGEQLTAVAAVTRERSFDPSARARHVTASAIFQRITQLEDQLGGTVAIATSADRLTTWLAPALRSFIQATGVRVELIVDDQDRIAEWLRSGRVLGAVTSKVRPVEGCCVETLGVMRYYASASPRFIQRWFKQGLTLEAFQRAPALFYDANDELCSRFLSSIFGDRVGPLTARLAPSPEVYLEASRLSVGWGMNAEHLVGFYLQRRRLVDLFPDQWLEVPLYWQHWGLASATLDSMTSALGGLVFGRQGRRAVIDDRYGVDRR